jgi:hypothetical protein
MRSAPVRLVFVCGLLLCACGASMGRKFDATHVNDIRQCVTTERDLLAWFGEPYERGNENGFPSLLWGYAHATITSSDRQMLVVYLNRSGQVVRFQFNPTALARDVQDVCAAGGTPAAR